MPQLDLSSSHHVRHSLSSHCTYHLLHGHLPHEIVIPLFLSFAPFLQFAQSLQIWQLLHPSNILYSPSGPFIFRVFSTLCILSLLELFMLGIYCRVWSCCFSPYLHSAQWPIAYNQIRRSGPLRTTKLAVVAHSAERPYKSNFSANSNLYSKLL
jgi:hypothetical protein